LIFGKTKYSRVWHNPVLGFLWLAFQTAIATSLISGTGRAQRCQSFFLNDTTKMFPALSHISIVNLMLPQDLEEIA
jgi:hypothetical protein